MQVHSIGASAAVAPTAPNFAQPVEHSKAGATFEALLEGALRHAGELESDANQAVRDLAIGRADSPHNVMLKVAKADLTFRLLLEIRNRVTEGLQEILRMQV